MELTSTTAVQIRDRVQRREVGAEEVARACLDRIERLNGRLNAFITTSAESALEQARQVDARVQAGETLPLAGIPVGVKDVLCTRDAPTTCGSRVLEGFRPPFDATAVRRLRDAGAVIVGKTNMDEFAMGSSNENSAYGAVRNPWDMFHARRNMQKLLTERLGAMVPNSKESGTEQSGSDDSKVGTTSEAVMP